MIRKAKAVWRSTGRDGNGDLSLPPGCSPARRTGLYFRARCWHSWLVQRPADERVHKPSTAT